MQIIILHGWGHNKKLWNSLSERLGKNAKAIDLPGFGNLSNDVIPAKAGIYTSWGVPEYARWVEKKISKNKDTILIGHSFGGL